VIYAKHLSRIILKAGVPYLNKVSLIQTCVLYQLGNPLKLIILIGSKFCEYGP
jgi:hypothetical protein